MSTSVSGSSAVEVLNTLDDGPGTAGLQVFSGLRPVAGDPPGAATLLCVVPLSKPAGDIIGGTSIYLTPADTGLVLVGGTATWGRLVDSAGNYVFDGDIGAEFVLSHTALIPGGSVALSDGVLTLTAVTPPSGSGGDLVYTTPRVVTQPVALVFGDTTTVPPELEVTASLDWDVNTARPVAAAAAVPWQTGVRAQAGRGFRWQPGSKTPASVQQPYQDAVRASIVVQARWQDTVRLARPATGLYQDASPIRLLPTRVTWGEAVRTERVPMALRFERGIRVGTSLLARYQEAIRDRRNYTASGFSEANAKSSWVSERETSALKAVAALALRYQEGMPPNAGIFPWPPLVGPDDRCYIPPLGDRVNLVFSAARAPGDLDLVFVCEESAVTPVPPALIVVPTQGVYIVLNEASLRRVDGNIPLPTFSMSIGIDYQSWAWSLNAVLPDAVLANIQPSAFGEPVEIEATVNGIVHRFLIDQVSRARSFNDATVSIRARGLTAELDAPFAAIQTFTNGTSRTAQQLMGDVLTDNGVPMPWSVDWQITDWSVPAGIWNHQGTYISALNAIAGAAGAYLLPNLATKGFSVLPAYPSLPRDWGSVSPDFELPASVVTVEGIEWVNRPAYNRVFVSGINAGVLGQVTVAGTDGGLVAPMVTDALITHGDAARQRGTAVIGATGRLANVTLSLPVLPAVGIIPPGKFVRYVDGATTRIGISRRVDVAVGTPEIFQTIVVETHE